MTPATIELWCEPSQVRLLSATCRCFDFSEDSADLAGNDPATGRCHVILCGRSPTVERLGDLLDCLRHNGITAEQSRITINRPVRRAS